MGTYTNGWLDDDKKYHVVTDDCLYNIALDYMGAGNRYTEIKTANSLISNVIYPGQVFIIPGVTPGYSPSPTPAPAYVPPISQPTNIIWYALMTGYQRKMEVIWEQAAEKFKVRWQIWDSNTNQLIPDGEEIMGPFVSRIKYANHDFTDNPGYYVARITIWPVNDNGDVIGTGKWLEYDFRNNPPELLPNPAIEIDTFDKLTIEFENIPDNKGIDGIEIAVYQDNNVKYATYTINVNPETRYASHISTLDPGHYYRMKFRSIRYFLADGTKSKDGIYGGWTDYTSNYLTSPIAPESITQLNGKKIVEQGVTSYGVFVEWTPVEVAKTYTIQWTINPDYFDDAPELVNSQTTEEGSGPKILLTNIELGHTYYFRVGSNNNKGSSLTWTPIKSINLGSRPSVPTTWSNTSSSVIGENLNLYWVHNATDGSLETSARLYLILIDMTNPEAQPITKEKIIDKINDPENPSTISVYTINYDDPEYKFLTEGFIIKWKVQTRGVGNEFSEYSTEREINVYTKPELTLDIRNKYGDSINNIYEFPFYIFLKSPTTTQIPLSYYIEITSNNNYETVDQVGNVKTVNVGDIIYKKFIDPELNAWELLAYMTPGDIDLQSGFTYTIKATISMDSGLIGMTEQTFSTEFENSSYDIFADIIINNQTLNASINPKANEWYYENDEPHTRLAQNCKLSVYRREYDGSFIEIASEIQNGENVFITDPHPALDYARYRVVVRSDENGTISFRDIPAVKVGEPSVVIQWAEKWTKFETSNNEEPIEPAWSGSMIRIPYNIDTSESNDKDVSLIEYIGRQHPVSYYGTQLGEASSWKVDIPADDKETLYNIRRLSKWMGDVYVREPSGVGYWAYINVSYSKTHNETIIPISFDIKRIEGGI